MHPPRRKKEIPWNVPGPGRTQSIRLVAIASFSARGMRLIYGRNDHFPALTCNLDVWRNREHCVFVRFHTRSIHHDNYSYQLTGISVPAALPKDSLANEYLLPEIVREAYEQWVLECLEYPLG